MVVRRQCAATTKAGARCRGQALPNDDQCFSHSPTMAAERTERNRRGGRNKATTVRAAKSWVAAGRKLNAEDLPVMLLGMAEAVASGDLEPARASATAQLIKTSLAVSTHLATEQRLAQLEAILGRLEEAYGSPARPHSGQRRHP